MSVRASSSGFGYRPAGAQHTSCRTVRDANGTGDGAGDQYSGLRWAAASARSCHGCSRLHQPAEPASAGRAGCSRVFGDVQTRGGSRPLIQHRMEPVQHSFAHRRNVNLDRAFLRLTDPSGARMSHHRPRVLDSDQHLNTHHEPLIILDHARHPMPRSARRPSELKHTEMRLSPEAAQPGQSLDVLSCGRVALTSAARTGTRSCAKAPGR